MSDTERPRPDDGGGVDDEDGEEPTEKGDPKEKKRKGCGKKGKKASFFRLKKGKKLLHQKGRQKGISANSGCLGRGVGGGGGWGWCLCMKQPRTLDSSVESPTSDPNSSEFSFDMLRVLIERNDFYSKECNPHLDADG